MLVELANDAFRKRESPMSVMSWLLEGDPAIRWQVMRDLMNEPVEVVAAERARVAFEGWGAKVLELQTPGGHWGRTIAGTRLFAERRRPVRRTGRRSRSRESIQPGGSKSGMGANPRFPEAFLNLVNPTNPLLPNNRLQRTRGFTARR
jgi:hypothetical protein